MGELVDQDRKNAQEGCTEVEEEGVKLARAH